MKEKKHGNWEKIVSGIKKHSGDSRTMHYCIVAVCGHERQSDNVYTDDRDGNADKSGRYSHRCIRQESV